MEGRTRAPTTVGSARPPSPLQPLLLLLLLIILAPSALADSPPPTVVAHLNTVSNDPNTGLVNFTLNITMVASPDDPNRDSTLASGQYYLFYTDPNGQTNQTLPFAEFHINDRPQWYWFTQNFSTIYQFPTYSFYVAFANVTTNATTQLSCGVNLTILSGGDSECGANIPQPPSGLAAVVNDTNRLNPDGTQNTSHALNITLAWPLSADDPNATTTGDYLYTAHVQDADLSCPSFNCVVTYTIGTGIGPGSGQGLRFQTLNKTICGCDGWWIFPKMNMTAYDTRTHLYTNASCTIQIDINSQNNTGCGGFTGSNAGFSFFPNLTLTAPGQSSGPTFPAVDLPSVSASTGLDTGTLGIILGGLLIAGCAMAGYALARQPGAVIAPAFGLALAGLMNLWPLWLIALIFLAITGLSVLLLTRGKGE